jgi:hypothetical protein
MAQVKVVGKVNKVFGGSSQGLELVESYQGQNGEEYSRSWTVWFAVAHNLTVGQEITVTGLFSNKIEDWVDGEGKPVLDKTGKPGRSIRLAINNAVVAESKPVVIVKEDLPF